MSKLPPNTATAVFTIVLKTLANFRPTYTAYLAYFTCFLVYCLSPPKCKLHGQEFCLFCLLLNLQLVEHLRRNRHSDICKMNGDDQVKL